LLFASTLLWIDMVDIDYQRRLRMSLNGDDDNEHSTTWLGYLFGNIKLCLQPCCVFYETLDGDSFCMFKITTMLRVVSVNDVEMDRCLEKGRYGVSKVFDTAYWGFLRVGTTFDIFQNILFPYGLNTVYWSFLDTAYWILFPSWSLVKCRHRYGVSFLMDTAYWLSEQ
ncbi:hypothetical protein Tco_0184271, partial [Tanacetum coccineum]